MPVVGGSEHGRDAHGNEDYGVQETTRRVGGSEHGLDAHGIELSLGRRSPRYRVRHARVRILPLTGTSSYKYTCDAADASGARIQLIKYFKYLSTGSIVNIY